MPNSSAPRPSAARLRTPWALRAVAVAWLALFAVASGVPAQTRTPGAAVPFVDDGLAEESALVAQAIPLQHQPVGEALLLVRPLLSARGSVELLTESNTLVVRDVASALARVLPVVHAFDHPISALKIEIQIIQAGNTAEVPSKGGPAIAPDLQQRLRKLLRFDNFQLMAKTQFLAREGEPVAYQIGDFGLSFRLGTVVESQRVKLHGFRMVREPGRPNEKQLIHSNLNPWLDQTTILGLASDESAGRALMVVVTCTKEQ
jgi:hypothetical protein